MPDWTGPVDDIAAAELRARAVRSLEGLVVPTDETLAAWLLGWDAGHAQGIADAEKIVDAMLAQVAPIK
jgi:hypothetical protein